MLWYSDALTEEGRPAIVALAATLAGNRLLAEACYVGAQLPPGPTPGHYIEAADGGERPITIQWPGLTFHRHGLRLHPNPSTPPRNQVEIAGDTMLALEVTHAQTSHHPVT